MLDIATFVVARMHGERLKRLPENSSPEIIQIYFMASLIYIHEAFLN